MAKTRTHLRIQNQLLNADNDFLPVVAPVPASLSVLCQVVSLAETTDVGQGPDVAVENGVFLRFGSTAATVPSTARYELAPGDQIIVPISNMNELYFAVSSTDGTFYLSQA